MPELPAAVESRAACATSGTAVARENLRRIAADQQSIVRLLRMPGPRAAQQVLAAAGVYDTAPRRREGLAVQVARAMQPAQLLALAIDVAMGAPRSLAAVVLARIRRALAGDRDLLTWARRDWPIGRFLDWAAGAYSSTEYRAKTNA